MDYHFCDKGSKHFGCQLLQVSVLISDIHELVYIGGCRFQFLYLCLEFRYLLLDIMLFCIVSIREHTELLIGHLAEYIVLIAYLELPTYDQCPLLFLKPLAMK